MKLIERKTDMLGRVIFEKFENNSGLLTTQLEKKYVYFDNESNSHRLETNFGYWEENHYLPNLNINKYSNIFGHTKKLELQTA